MRALFVAVALAACGGVGGQPGGDADGDADGDGDGDADGDAGGDADGDAAADPDCSAATDSGPLEYPACCPQFHDLPWGRVGSTSVERGDVEYEFVVTRMLETGFVAELDPERDPDDEPQVSVILPPGMAANVRLPEVGDPIISLGGACVDLSGYLRVTTPSGELIYEGGAPSCGDGLVDVWPVPPRLTQRPVPSEPCIDFMNNAPPSPEFCCVTRTDMEVVLHGPDGDSVVVPGEDREIEIDGLRYLVSSQGAYSFHDGPGGGDIGGSKGSAFIVRLAEP